jgi:hypothetical protein
LLSVLDLTLLLQFNALLAFVRRTLLINVRLLLGLLLSGLTLLLALLLLLYLSLRCPLLLISLLRGSVSLLLTAAAVAARLCAVVLVAFPGFPAPWQARSFPSAARR